jgi:hypothetical protein
MHMDPCSDHQKPAGLSLTEEDSVSEGHSSAAEVDEPPDFETGGHSSRSSRTAEFSSDPADGRPVPHPSFEEALALLNQDRLLTENVFNTARQMGINPMSIIETILERRG